MLNIERKITRKDFPAHNIPAQEWRGEFLRIRVVKKPSEYSRFTIISSKKLYKSKPIRNIFKRRVYSVIRQSLHKFDKNPHGYFIIFPLIHMEKITFLSIKNDLDRFISSTLK